MDPEIITIDIQDVAMTPKGKKVLNALLASGAELFQTKRGRLAIHIKCNTVAKVQSTLGLVMKDSYDGLQAFAFGEPQKPEVP